MEGATGMSAATTALKSAITEMGSEMTGLIGEILPVAIGVVGAILVVTFGLKIFKKVSAKA